MSKDYTNVDKIIYKKLKETNRSIYKDEAPSSATYPFMIYEYSLSQSTPGKNIYNLNIHIWGNKDNVQVNDMAEEVLKVLDNEMLFDDVASYRFFSEPNEAIELFEKSIRNKTVRFELIRV